MLYPTESKSNILLASISLLAVFHFSAMVTNAKVPELVVTYDQVPRGGDPPRSWRKVWTAHTYDADLKRWTKSDQWTRTGTETKQVTTVGVSDVTGDRRADLVNEYIYNGRRNFSVRKSNSNTFVASADRTWYSETDNTGGSKIAKYVADVDADQLSDLIIQIPLPSGGWEWRVLLSEKTSFKEPERWATSVDSNLKFLAVEDVANRDGRADLIVIDQSGDVSRIRVFESKAGGFFDVTSNSWAEIKGEFGNTKFGDINNDGLTDFVVQKRVDGGYLWEPWINNGKEAFRNDTWKSSESETDYAIKLVKVIDLDRDGYDDLVLSYHARSPDNDVVGVRYALPASRSFESPGSTWFKQNRISGFQVLDITHVKRTLRPIPRPKKP